MRSIDDMRFYTERKGGRFVGRVIEFADLRSKPSTSPLAALDEIISLASERLRDIDSARRIRRRNG